MLKNSNTRHVSSLCFGIAVYCVCLCVYVNVCVFGQSFCSTLYWSVWKDSDNELTFLLCEAAWEIFYGNGKLNCGSTFGSKWCGVLFFMPLFNMCVYVYVTL